MQDNKLGPIAVQVLLGVMILASLLLIRQNLQLRQALIPEGPNTLEIGTTLTAFTANSLNGEMSVDYGPSQKGKIFLYLSPRCDYCARQMPIWHELLQKVDKSDFDIYAVTRDTEALEPLRQYLKNQGLERLPVILAPERIWRGHRLYGTPTTLVVSRDGTVLGQWRGVWGLEVREEARSVLGIEFVAEASIPTGQS